MADTLIIVPFVFDNWLNNRLDKWKLALKLIDRILSNSDSAEGVSLDWVCKIPALLTNTSNRPNLSTVCPTTRWICSESVKSAVIQNGLYWLGDNDCRFSQILITLSVFLSTHTSLAFNLANSWAIDWPITEVQPSQ